MSDWNHTWVSRHARVAAALFIKAAVCSARAVSSFRRPGARRHTGEPPSCFSEQGLCARAGLQVSGHVLGCGRQTPGVFLRTSRLRRAVSTAAGSNTHARGGWLWGALPNAGAWLQTPSQHSLVLTPPATDQPALSLQQTGLVPRRVSGGRVFILEPYAENAYVTLRPPLSVPYVTPATFYTRGGWCPHTRN